MATKQEAHLSLIQGVVARLGQNSCLLKGWSVLLISALLVVGGASADELVLAVGFLPAVVFWGLDGYLLWQERLFRGLYDQVRKQDDRDVDLSMDVTGIRSRGLSPKWLAATFSRTLIAFHGVILATVLTVLLLVRVR